MPDTLQTWYCARGALRYEGPAGIMAILNLTPDSFYDGNRYFGVERAIKQARLLVQAGADLLDLGAESSRPFSDPVSAEEEMDRLLPVLDALQDEAKQTGLTLPAISVDTYHAKTAAAALEHGASIINDISACCSFDPELMDVLVQYKPGYVLMHSKGKPKTMQQKPDYDDVVLEVAQFFETSLNTLVQKGLPEQNVLLDPGIGFGKSAEHNIALMRSSQAWSHLQRPSLMALSMKSVFGALFGLDVQERGSITQVATVLTTQAGYTWHRVHDVAATKQSLALAAELGF